MAGKDSDVISSLIAIMEALRVIMAHNDKPDLGPMTKTWQFDFLIKTIDNLQK